MASVGPGVAVIPTETVVFEGSKPGLKWLRDVHGMELVQEGQFGKYLLRAPEGGDKGVAMAFNVAREAFKSGKARVAHPNFLRVVRRPGPSSSKSMKTWNLSNPGNPGVPGADVHAHATWTITEGDPDVRVAILDEGVDSRHKYLKDAIVDEADFVDGNDHARPDGDDAHGTACAGIVGSRHSDVRGVAPGVSLVGVRIAKSNHAGFWIFDDFDTADAIDWAWKEGKSAVLSNSWGGGPQTDVITRAFERAAKNGRNGKGSVVVAAAGNDQAPVDFPGTLPFALTIGASNPWDKRKTKTSQDGEYWWGSNFGKGLDIMAPGVKIPTTDIRGRRGYSTTLFTPNFNGTSSATPHAAAAAALVITVRPNLKEDVVRRIIAETADSLSGSKKWNKHTGFGRLNVYRALWAARRI
jgi:subtilisin family serine protease